MEQDRSLLLGFPLFALLCHLGVKGVVTEVCQNYKWGVPQLEAQTQLINNGKLILLGLTTLLGEHQVPWGYRAEEGKGSGRTLEMEKEAEEKEAEGKIRRADPAFYLPGVPTPLYQQEKQQSEGLLSVNKN